MKGKRIFLFKFLFSLTAMIIFISISSQLLKNINPPEIYKQISSREQIKLQKVDTNLIKSLIKEGKLSNKEAMYYEIIKEK